MVYTAGIFLFNEKNELLVVHPINAPMNRWSIPKGLVDPNETRLEAAKREMFEETNVDLDKLKLVYLHEGKNISYATKKKTLCSFFGKVLISTKELELKCNSLFEGKTFYENDQIVWMPIDKAITVIHETQVKAIELFRLDPFSTL